MDYIDQQCALAKQLAQINMRGVESQDDLLLQYALENGYVQPPSDRFWLPNQNPNVANEQAKFTRGLFNPMSRNAGAQFGPDGGPGAGLFGRGSDWQGQGVIAGVGQGPQVGARVLAPVFDGAVGQQGNLQGAMFPAGVLGTANARAF